MKWYTEGVPSENVIQAKRKKESECKININNLLGRLSEIEAKTLYEMIGAKFGFSASVQVAPLPVQTPVQTVVNTIPAETPKKKVVVVHKKNALADSGMIPAEIANKVYEPLNPECTMNLCEFCIISGLLRSLNILKTNELIISLLAIITVRKCTTW